MSIRTAITAAAAFAAATLVPASGAIAAPAATQPVKVISSCTAAKYEPTRYIFYCGDATQGMTQAEFTLFRVVKTAKYGPLFSRASVDTRQGHQIYVLPTSTM